MPPTTAEENSQANVAPTELVGIGGWLLFFVGTMCFGALMALVDGYEMVSDGERLLGILSTGFSIGMFFVVFMVLRRDVRAPMFAKYFLLIEIVFLAADYVFWDSALFRTIVFAVQSCIWYRYFDVSRRVAATFRVAP